MEVFLWGTMWSQQWGSMGAPPDVDKGSIFVTGFRKINHFVTFDILNISTSNKALHSINQHCSEHRISLCHELPEILWNIYSLHVYCYGNNAKYWVPFISCVTKWLIFQNPVTFKILRIVSNCSDFFKLVTTDTFIHNPFDTHFAKINITPYTCCYLAPIWNMYWRSKVKY